MNKMREIADNQLLRWMFILNRCALCTLAYLHVHDVGEKIEILVSVPQLRQMAQVWVVGEAIH